MTAWCSTEPVLPWALMARSLPRRARLPRTWSIFDSTALTGDRRPVDPAEDAAVYQALVLGTRDYVRKCGFSKVLVGLSGGVDSALVAAIAVDALGKENVTTIGMPSQYSSAGSIDDARALADNLGIRYTTIAIHDLFEQYTKALAPLFAGRQPDITEENIQSRIRGNLLMALSNKFNALVLTTGNKSEMSVGYCTLYGDMVGALAVIGDVVKTEVYQLCRYLNRERDVIPLAYPGEAAFGRASSGAEGYGFSTTLRGARSHSASLRRALRNPGADCRRIPFRSGDSLSGSQAGRAQRIQTPAGGAGAQGHQQVFWHGAPFSHRR